MEILKKEVYNVNSANDLIVLTYDKSKQKKKKNKQHKSATKKSLHSKSTRREILINSITKENNKEHYGSAKRYHSKFNSPKKNSSNALISLTIDHSKSMKSSQEFQNYKENLKKSSAFQRKIYDETMGKRKQEIIQNIKYRPPALENTDHTINLKFPTLTNRTLKEGFANVSMMESFHTSKYARNNLKELKVIKEEKPKSNLPNLNEHNSFRRFHNFLNTIQDNVKEIEDSDHYESEYFSDNDLYGSSQSDMGKFKYTTLDNEERSKYYSAYIEEVEKQQILPRRMGFQSK